MGVNSVGGVNGSVYTEYEAPAKSEAAASETAAKDAVVYDKAEKGEKKATYSINKMSASDRAALVEQLKADQAEREKSLTNIVTQMLGGQAKAYGIATGDYSIWRMFASGNFTVDAATKAQAEKDIAEDGYWGVKQTAQRLFDFASALAGDDEEKMRAMEKAMNKGFREATKSWGRELPGISQDTQKAATQLFADYYKSKQVS